MPIVTDTRETRELAYEVKFLVDVERGRRIRDWARARLEPDPHGTGPRRDEYRITSLYFDTDALDVFHRRGSFGRAKYRIRRYGDSDVVFLERKMRTSSLLTKHRTSIAMDDLNGLNEDEARSDWTGRWFHRRLLARRLRPTCQVSYIRMARVSAGAFGLNRLTIDDQLLADRRCALEFEGLPILPVLERQVILELKFRVTMPAVFKQLVEEFRLSPAPVSKYRFSVMTLNEWAAGGPAKPSQPAAGVGRLVYA